MSDSKDPQVSGSATPSGGGGGGNIYAQVNFLLPPSQADFPSPEVFNRFAPKVQEVILEMLRKEQADRQNYLTRQQAYEHELNLKREANFFSWRCMGTLLGFVLVVAIILAGAWLVKSGASWIGVGTMLVGLAGVIGSALYGHKAQNPQPPK